jgi:hypothetical protein
MNFCRSRFVSTLWPRAYRAAMGETAYFSCKPHLSPLVSEGSTTSVPSWVSRTSASAAAQRPSEVGQLRSSSHRWLRCPPSVGKRVSGAVPRKLRIFLLDGWGRRGAVPTFHVKRIADRRPFRSYRASPDAPVSRETGRKARRSCLNPCNRQPTPVGPIAWRGWGRQ